MASRKRKMAELSKIFSEMTIEQREKYKRTPAQRQEAADNRQRDQEAKAAYLRNMYKKNTNKKAGGKVGSKNKDPYGEKLVEQMSKPKEPLLLRKNKWKSLSKQSLIIIVAG